MINQIQFTILANLSNRLSLRRDFTFWLDIDVLFAQFQDANRIRIGDDLNDMYLSWNVKVVKFQFVFAHFSFSPFSSSDFFKDSQIGGPIASSLHRFTQYVSMYRVFL